MEVMDVSTRGVVFEDELEIRHVPWYSMNEWKDVYQQIYSDNLEDRKKGLESLQVWKARSSSIPYAVECTYMVLRIEVKDEEQLLNKNPDDLLLDDDDICMMYCTAITRFLNQILSIDHKKAPVESMYKLASRMHIPQWVVKLRHDASHGTDLPPLPTMREAAKVALYWLNDNYWKNELENIRDYNPSLKGKNCASIITRLVDTRQSTYLFTRTNCWSASHIPDKSFRITLSKIKDEFLQENPEYKDAKVKRWKLNHAIAYMDKKIYLSVKDETCAKELLEVLISSDGFLVDEDVLKLYKIDINEGETLGKLPTDLVQQWRDTIGILHAAQLLPDLIDKLFHRCSSENEDSLECNVAALWLNEIAQAIIKLRLVQNILIKSGINLKEKMNLAKYASYRINLISGDITSSDSLLGNLEKSAQQQVLKENPSLASAISLSSAIAAPPPSMFTDIVKKAAFAPNKHSLLYIQSMIDLLADELSEVNARKILDLMYTYLGKWCINGGLNTSKNSMDAMVNGTEIIYTLGDLKDVTKDAGLPDSNNSLCVTALQSKETDGWTQYSDSGGQWLFVCGLGRLPWQHDVTSEDFMLPRVWVSCDNDSELLCNKENHISEESMDIC